ncbi:hypothetical protein BpHYR1_031767 [Brachionus plicatilis]|uniref:Uncharacterized protein n=1 Tax=Brachionus plicatilis TaxID=10195 RepID=A0A3M7QP89_BRAPC|nr:hypothetical protein BpHYR1_031767 [Brachionus plicatilis]
MFTNPVTRTRPPNRIFNWIPKNKVECKFVHSINMYSDGNGCVQSVQIACASFFANSNSHEFQHHKNNNNKNTLAKKKQRTKFIKSSFQLMVY